MIGYIYVLEICTSQPKQLHSRLISNLLTSKSEQSSLFVTGLVSGLESEGSNAGQDLGISHSAAMRKLWDLRPHHIQVLPLQLIILCLLSSCMEQG